MKKFRGESVEETHGLVQILPAVTCCYMWISIPCKKSTWRFQAHAWPPVLLRFLFGFVERFALWQSDVRIKSSKILRLSLHILLETTCLLFSLVTWICLAPCSSPHCTQLQKSRALSSLTKCKKRKFALVDHLSYAMRRFWYGFVMPQEFDSLWVCEGQHEARFI